MKKILNVLLLTLITVSLSYSQRIEQNDLYTVVYSESYQQPLYLTYKYPYFLTNEYEIIKGVVLEGKDIEKTPVTYPNVITLAETKDWKVPTGIITSDDKDYENNEYDHGHLVPKESFKNDEEKQDYLWSYLNCALMHETLNGGVWRVLEDYERKLNKEENVRVKVILSFSDDSKLTDGGATVPTHFTKIIEYGYSSFSISEEEITREVYTFPNDSVVKGKKIEEFKIKHLSGKFITHE
jgi:hypothetical protein